MTIFPGCLDVDCNARHILWNKVEEDGFRLVFIKASQGYKYVDPAFDANYDKAQCAGLLVVPYHVASIEPASIQAGHFVDTVGLKWGHPYMIDGTLSDAQTVKGLGEALIVATGRLPIISRPVGWVSRAWPWAAPLSSSPPPDDEWLFWTYSHGAVPGVRMSVDKIAFNGSALHMMRWHETGKLP